MPTTEYTTETVARRLVQASSAAVESSEAAAIAGEPDAVHRHRTQVRRMRSILAVVRKIADRGSVDAVRASLTEWGAQLGDARDAEVRIARAESALAAAKIGDPAVRRRLVEDERPERERLHARIVVLDRTEPARGRRQLLRESGLDVRVDGADPDARAVFGMLLRREARRVTRAAKKADGSLESDHEVRKAARRLRHLAEALGGAVPELFGEDAARLARRAKRVHALLGDQRDELLLAERVERIRADAVRDGEDGAPYDVLAKRARARAEGRLAKLPKALKRLKKAAKAIA